MRLARTIALGASTVLLAASAVPASARPATEKAAAPAKRHDTLFPTVGSTAFDVRRYDVRLHYTPSSNRLRATTVITAHAPKRLTRCASTSKA